MADKIDWLRVFTFHGLEQLSNNGQVRSHCPSCSKPKLYLNPESGGWDCKSCGSKGSPYDYFTLLVESGKATTVPADYARLAEDRGLEISTLKKHHLVQNPLNGEWILPCYNSKGTIINLYTYREIEGKARLISCGIKQSYFGSKTLSKNTDRPLWILEGQWDYLAFYEMLKKLGKVDKHDFVAVPGANTFPKTLLGALPQRKVLVAYDNDDAGAAGIDRVRSLIEADSIPIGGLWRYNWPDTWKEKADIRDMLVQDGPTQAWKTLSKNLVSVPFELGRQYVKKNECQSFEEVVEACKTKLRMNQYLEDALAISLCVSYSIRLTGVSLWFYVVGPSGSGKTTIVECAAGDSNRFRAESKFTGLHSGSRQLTDEGDDPSLITQIQGKTLFIKDWTTILTMPPTLKDNIYGELRDAYDGHSSVYYRTGRTSVADDINIGVIGCVTDAIRGENQTALGERFLQIEVVPPVSNIESFQFRNESRRLIRQAIKNAIESVNTQEEDSKASGLDLTEIKATTAGYLDYLYNQPIPSIEFPISSQNTVLALAELVAICRSQVKRGRDRSPLYRPRQEYGTRISAQLTKLAITLAIVLGRKSVDNAVLRIVAKVARDTAYGYAFDLVDYLSKNGEGQTLTMAKWLGMSPSHVRNVVADLMILQTVQTAEPVSNGSGRGGKKTHVYKLTPSAESVLKAAKLETLLKPV